MSLSRTSREILFRVAAPLLWAAAPGGAFGQSASDLYRITDGVSGAVSAFHQVSVPKGNGTILATLQGPGKVTFFHLDGKTLTHSPGTEDEYGSCWEDPRWRTFSSIYCGHPLNESGVNRMYRWYVANPVRFQQGLKVEIQNQHDNGRPTTTDADDYTSLAFWYQEGPQRVAALPGFMERTAGSFPGKK